MESALKQRLRQNFLWRALSSSDFANTFYGERSHTATSPIFILLFLLERTYLIECQEILKIPKNNNLFD
jgi:hypothetical protein